MATTVHQAADSPLHDVNTQLSIARTRLSAERTLMSWIRTAFSMITFGFTMGKFLEYLDELAPTGMRTGDGRAVAVLLILFGLVSLVAGGVEYRRMMMGLDASAGVQHRPTSLGVIAGLVAILGVFAFAGLFMRIDL